MQLGIDVGYYQLKYVSQSKRGAFSSISGRYNAANFSLNGHQDIVLNDAHGQWVVGEGAVGQTRFLQRNEDGRWYQTPLYRRLMLAGFGQVTSGTSVKMRVVTGLPVANYQSGKKDVEELFSGQHRVDLEGRQAQRIDVQMCRVVPQPFGTIFAMAMNDAGKIVNKSLVKGPTAVIDIGGKTTNLLKVVGLRDDETKTTSINLGGWDIVRAATGELRKQYPDMDLDDDQRVAEAIRERKIWYYDRFIDLSASIDEIAAEMAQKIHSRATELWRGGGDLRHVLITGGGSYLLGQRLTERFRQAQIAPNAQFANAHGYWKFANFLDAHS